MTWCFCPVSNCSTSKTFYSCYSASSTDNGLMPLILPGFNIWCFQWFLFDLCGSIMRFYLLLWWRGEQSSWSAASVLLSGLRRWQRVCGRRSVSREQCRSSWPPPPDPPLPACCTPHCRSGGTRAIRKIWGSWSLWWCTWTTEVRDVGFCKCHQVWFKTVIPDKLLQVTHEKHHSSSLFFFTIFNICMLLPYISNYWSILQIIHMQS